MTREENIRRMQEAYARKVGRAQIAPVLSFYEDRPQLMPRSYDMAAGNSAAGRAPTWGDRARLFGEGAGRMLAPIGEALYDGTIGALNDDLTESARSKIMGAPPLPPPGDPNEIFVTAPRRTIGQRIETIGNDVRASLPGAIETWKDFGREYVNTVADSITGRGLVRSFQEMPQHAQGSKDIIRGLTYGPVVDQFREFQRGDEAFRAGDERKAADKYASSGFQALLGVANVLGIGELALGGRAAQSSGKLQQAAEIAGVAKAPPLEMPADFAPTPPRTDVGMSERSMALAANRVDESPVDEFTAADRVGPEVAPEPAPARRYTAPRLPFSLGDALGPLSLGAATAGAFALSAENADAAGDGGGDGTISPLTLAAAAALGAPLLRGRGVASAADRAREAAAVRMSMGERALAANAETGMRAIDALPRRGSVTDMVRGLTKAGVNLSPDEKATMARAFGNRAVSRRDIEDFMTTVASPRNHFTHNVDGFGAVAQRMTDEEIASLSARTAPQVASMLDELRRIAPVSESAAVAVAGGAKKGWYLRSQKALEQVFGADAPRFAAVLAALSPQTSVESNLTNAVRFWTNWTKAGRPTEERQILDILAQSVQGGKGEDSVLGAWRNNTVRAIQAENAEDALLSGPKVDSFRRNLRARKVPGLMAPSSQPARRGANSTMDDTEYAVTNDAWMANYFNVDQEMFARGGGMDQPGYSPGYLATNAYVREVAEHLSKVTGETWTPREVQETIWSWAKTLYEAREAAGETRTAAQLVRERALTDAQIGGTPDFAILLQDSPALRTVLEEAGYGRQIADLAGTPGGVYGDAPGFLGVRTGPQDATGSGFSQRDYERRLGRAASRLDDLASRRARESREERVRTARLDFAGDGGVPRAYARGGGSGGKVPRVLGLPAVETFAPEPAFQKAYAKNQIEMPVVHQLPATPEAGAAFAKAIQNSVSRGPFGAAVHVYSPDEYAKMSLFVSADGQSGFALKGDDIVSVFSNPKAPPGRTDSLIPLAVQMGGRRLDAFDTVLPRLYAKHGFRVESRLRWNDEFAPAGWDKSTFARYNNGEPDVVFMVWDPSYQGAPKATDGLVASSYDEAVAAQSAAQKAVADRIASGAVARNAEGSGTAANVDDKPPPLPGPFSAQNEAATPDAPPANPRDRLAGITPMLGPAAAAAGIGAAAIGGAPEARAEDQSEPFDPGYEVVIRPDADYSGGQWQRQRMQRVPLPDGSEGVIVPWRVKETREERLVLRALENGVPADIIGEVKPTLGGPIRPTWPGENQRGIGENYPTGRAPPYDLIPIAERDAGNEGAATGAVAGIIARLATMRGLRGAQGVNTGGLLIGPTVGALAGAGSQLVQDADAGDVIKGTIGGAIGGSAGSIGTDLARVGARDVAIPALRFVDDKVSDAIRYKQLWPQRRGPAPGLFEGATQQDMRDALFQLEDARNAELARRGPKIPPLFPDTSVPPPYEYDKWPKTTPGGGQGGAGGGSAGAGAGGAGGGSGGGAAGGASSGAERTQRTPREPMDPAVIARMERAAATGLKGKPVGDLRKAGEVLGVPGATSMRKDDLVKEIARRMAADGQRSNRLLRQAGISLGLAGALAIPALEPPTTDSAPAPF